MIHQKTWQPWMGGETFCTIPTLRNSLKIFFSENPGPILKRFHRIVPWVTLFKNSSPNFDLSKNMAAMGGGGFLHCVDLKKFFEKSTCQNLELFPKNVPCMTLFENCSQNFDPSKNMAAIGERFFALCRLKRNSSKFFSSETASQILK